MDDSSGHCEALPRTELDHSARSDAIGGGFEIDEKAAGQDEEELVVNLVVMPVILASHDAQADDGVVHARQRLIVPGVLHRRRERVDIDPLERIEEDVQVRCVRKRVCGLVGHRGYSE